jgi:hypothetical protein
MQENKRDVSIKCTKDDIISGRWRTMLAEAQQQKPKVTQPQVNTSKSQATKNKNHSYTQCPYPSDPDSKESGWRSSKNPDSRSKYFDVDGVKGKYRYSDHWHKIIIESFTPRQCPQFKNPNGAISFTIIIKQATNRGHVNNLTSSDKDWEEFCQLFSTYETELLWTNGATIDKTAKTITLKIPKNYDPGDSVPRQQLCELLKKYRCAVLS